MNDPLPLFESSHAPSTPEPQPLTDAQRTALRECFAALGVATAREQFALVEEFTGVRIDRVIDLTVSDAQSLIYALRARVHNAERPNTGDSWADRDEDTWIDRL